MTDNESEFDFTGVEPGDGVHIRRVELGDELSLHAVFISGGDYYEPDGMVTGDGSDPHVPLAEWQRPTPEQRGECNRLQLVLEAVARYITTGGTWSSLSLVIHRMKLAVPDGFVYSPYFYHSGSINTDCVYEHVFVSRHDRGELTPVILWVENSFIEPKTLRELLDEQRAVDEGTATWVQVQEEGGGPGRPEEARPVELLPGAGAGTQEHPD